MEQLELLSIENPCINVCQSDKRGYCEGCFRSRQERFDWNKLSVQEKRRVLELCKQRGKRRKAKARKEAEQERIAAVNVETAATPEESSKEAPQVVELPSKSETVRDMGLDMFDL